MHQRIIQLELNYSGSAAVGTSIREINYPVGVSGIESLCVWRRSAYLAASGKAGGWWVIRLYHHTGIAEVTGSNPVEALIFQAFSFRLLKLENVLR